LILILSLKQKGVKYFYVYEILSNMSILFSLRNVSSMAEETRIVCLCYSYIKFLLQQMINIFYLTNLSLEHLMIYVKLIHDYFILVGNVLFFILSRGSHNVLSILRSFNEHVKNYST